MPGRPVYSLALRNVRGGEDPLEPESALLVAIWRIRAALREEPVGTVGVVSHGPKILARWIRVDSGPESIGDDPFAGVPIEIVDALDSMSEEDIREYVAKLDDTTLLCASRLPDRP